MNKEGQISEECYEALKEALEKDIEERTARVEKESLNVYSLYESNKEFRDVAEGLAAVFEEPIERVLEKFEKACGTLIEQTGKALKNIALYYAESSKDYEELQGVRPPSEIKKELKHEKNHMRIKQLNRELNESYRWYRGKRWIIMEFRYAIVFKRTGCYRDGTPHNTVHTVHNKKELLELWSKLITMHLGHSYSVEDLNSGLTVLSGEMHLDDFKVLKKLPEESWLNHVILQEKIK